MHRQTLRDRTVALLLVAGLLAGCDQASASSPPDGGSPNPQSPAPTSPPAASAGPQQPSPSATVLADGLTLAGAVPGTSLGSLALWGDLAVANVWSDYRAPGPDDGFVVIDVADPTRPTQLARFRCAASYNDISIWGDLVVLSQDSARAGPACDAPEARAGDEDAFAGLRIVSIADPAAPVLLASVPTGIDERAGSRAVYGSHTNTLLPDLDHVDSAGHASPRLIVYASMYYHPGVKPSASIVEVPLDDPGSARVIGSIDNGQTVGCHDITVFLPRSIMACAAYEAGVVLFDVTDPEHPAMVSHLIEQAIARQDESHHSTAFSNDGRTLLVNAEIYTDVGVTPCAGGTTSNRGSLWFYDIADPANAQQRGSFQLPRGNPAHLCYPHESNVIPTTGDRDLAVNGWFGGGVDIVDFTDPSAPFEVAFWTSSEANGGHSFDYAAYWYNGAIYAGNLSLFDIDIPPSTRGFDVLTVDPALVPDAVELPGMNAQLQLPLPDAAGG